MTTYLAVLEIQRCFKRLQKKLETNKKWEEEEKN